MIHQLEVQPAPGIVAQPKASEGVKYPLAALARWTWIFLALVTLAGAVSGTLVLDGSAGLVVAVVLFLAGLFSLRVYGRLGVKKRARTGMAVVLVLFIISQLTTRVDNLERKRWESGLDFSAYYTAGAMLRANSPQHMYYLPLLPDGRMELFPEDGHDSYWSAFARTLGISRTMPFNYPPFAAVLIKPLTNLRYEAAWRLWRCLTVILLLASLVLALSIADVEPLLPALVVATVGVLSFFPVSEMLFLGQMGAVILFLWTGGVYLLLRHRPIYSGLCFALGTMIKLTPVLVVPVFLLRRQWRWLGAYCAGIVVLGVISVWQAGWPTHTYYKTAVLPAISCGTPGYMNKSIIALVQNLWLQRVPLVMEETTLSAGICKAGKIVSMLIFGAVLFACYLKNRRKDALIHEAVLFAAASLLISPVSWRHHYVLAILPLIYLWCRSGAQASGWRVWLLTAATLVSGTQLADYVTVLIRNAPLNLIVCGSMPVLMLILVLVNAEHNQQHALIGLEAKSSC